MPAAHHAPNLPDQPAQWFVFGGCRDKPRPTVSLPVAPWARAYGLDRDSDAGTIPLLGPGPRFDRPYAMTTDLTDPVIVATLPASAGLALPLLIDGTHRLFKAHATGAAELPAYLLTEAETLTIRALR